MVLLLVMLVGVGSSAWAETYSLTPDKTSTGSNATSYITTLTEFTHNGISWKMNQWNPSSLQIKTNQSSAASEFRFYNTSAFAGRITKVVITFSALTVNNASKLMFLGGTSTVTATTGGTAGTWNSTAKTLTWTPGTSDNFTYFAFYQDGQAASGTNKLAITDAIVVTYEKSSNFTITYDGNGNTSGTVPTDGNTYDATNNTVTVLGNTGNLAKEHYSFNCWNTKADGTGVDYLAGNTFTIAASTTLYAKWTANTHNVSLPVADEYGSYTMSTTSPVAYGTEVTLTYIPATGYEDYVATWSINGEAINGNKFTMPDEDVTITAKVDKALTIDFEKALGETNYTNWTFSNLGITNTIAPHGGSNYGFTQSTTTAYAQTTEKVNPISLTCYLSKSSGNTNPSTWSVQVSTDLTNWTDVNSTSATDMNYGVWKKFEVDLSKHNDVYVRVYYNGSTAVRCIDDVTLILRSSDETSIISDATIDLTAEETSGEIAYYISNPIEGNVLTASTTADWISNINVTAEKVTFNTTTNTGDARSAIITLAYGTLSKEITVSQAKHVVTNTYALTTAVVPGRHYIITNGSSAALGEDRGNNRLAIDITVSDNQTTFGSDAGITEFLVGIDESTGFFTLFDTDKKKYLSSASSSSNYMKLVESISDDNAKWIITFDERSRKAFIQAQGDYTRNIIRYNSSNNPALFSCYASGQNDVYLFEKVGDNGVQTFTVNIAEACTDGKKYYGTFSAPFAFTVPSDVTVSEIGVIDDELLVEDYTPNAVIPANTGVMISSTTPGAKTFTSAKGGNSTLGDENNLQPTLWGVTDTEMSKKGASCMFYRLTMHNANVEGATSEIGFWWGADGGAAFNYLTPNRAYLAVPTTSTARQNFWFDSESTRISDSKMAKTTKGSLYYDLQGRQVAQPTKGLYIVNGNKVIIK